MKYTILNKFKSFYRDISIRYKLLLLFYIQILIPLIFIGYMSYQKSSEVIKNKSINYSQDLLKMIEVRLDDLDENMDSLSQELLLDRRVYDVLNSSDGDENKVSFYNDVYNILRKTTLSRQEIQSICLISSKGDIYYFDSNISKVNIKQMLPYDGILNSARQAGGKLCWYLDKKDGAVQNIYVTRIVNNRDNFSEIGMLAVLIKKEYLQSIYRDLISDSLKNVSIITYNNEEILSRNKDYSYLLNEFYSRNIEGQRGYYIDSKNKMLVSYVPIPKLHWTIVSHLSLKELNREIDMLRLWIILTFIASLCILTVLSLLTAMDIIEPLNKLVKGMKKVERGESHEDIELNRNDELGYLSQSFNRMSRKIDYLVNSIYKEQITRKEAELKALQAQINPHFLFNTLESINWMAQLHDASEISEVVTALASLMDANIGRDDKLIPLREEFDYINNYIAIIKSRYEDKLSIVKEIDESLLDMSIPKLLIQPLIENAVYHGIEKITRPGEIKIRAFRQKGAFPKEGAFQKEEDLGQSNDVIIEVRDNGMGMSEEELDALNDRLSSDSSPIFGSINVKRKSIGLENVNRRIKLFYGEEYGLKIESKYGEYTNVRVRIPEIKINEGEAGHV